MAAAGAARSPARALTLSARLDARVRVNITIARERAAQMRARVFNFADDIMAYADAEEDLLEHFGALLKLCSERGAALGTGRSLVTSRSLAMCAGDAASESSRLVCSTSQNESLKM